MMNEIQPKESSEIKMPEANKYKEIKPENGTTYSDATQFWNQKFSDNGSENQMDQIYYDDNGEKYREGNLLDPNITFEKNGYIYQTDEMGRVISAEGKLQVKDHELRNKIMDKRDVVAHGKMEDSDERGHLIADRFNGSGELENLVPMEHNLNHGAYAKLEGTLADAIKNGADVKIKVESIYSGDSYRPDEFRISYTIDKDKEVVVFKNRGVE